MGPEEHPGATDAFGEPEPGPPPAPTAPRWEQQPDPASVAARPAPRRPGRTVLVVLLVLLVGAGGFTGGLATAPRIDVPALLGGDVADADEAALLGLLTDVTATEGVMLRFNDEVGEQLAGVQDEAEALDAIAVAAASGAGGLRALRPGIVGRSGDGTVDEVRDVYLPHLDSWIDYLAALATDPDLLFAVEDQQPYLLLINATAEAFGDTLEALLATDPVPQVAELAERILDDGFRSEGPAPTL